MTHEIHGTRPVTGRRELVVGGSAGLALGALGLLAPPARAAGVDTRAQLTAALDQYMATRAGAAGLTVRDNRNGSYFHWRPRTQQTHSTIKVLILITTLKIAQDRGQGLTSTQKSLASRMIRFSDNDATNTLLTQATLRRCRIVADQLGMDSTVVLGGTSFRSSSWWGHSTSTTRDLVQMMNHVVLGTYLSPGRRAYVRELMANVTSTQTWGLGDGLPERRPRRAEERLGPAARRLPAQRGRASSRGAAATTRWRSCRGRPTGTPTARPP